MSNKRQAKRRIMYQIGMFAITFVNYMILHATRSAWSLATKDLEVIYGFSTGEISYMNATFLLAYSLGGFFLSHLGDVYSKRHLICLMYSLIALIEIILGSMQFVPLDSQKAGYFFAIKALNGLLQSFAWAVNFGILGNWFPKKGRGILVGIWATNPSLGDIIGNQLYIAFTKENSLHWGYTFITLGCLIECIALLNFCCLVEYPISLGIVINEKANILDPTKSEHNF